jgi:hypothetical protein
MGAFYSNLRKDYYVETSKIYKEIYDRKEHYQQHLKTNVNCGDFIPRTEGRIK